MKKMKNSYGLNRGEVVARKYIRVRRKSSIVSMQRDASGKITGPGRITPCTIDDTFPVRDDETIDSAKSRLIGKGYDILGVFESLW